MKSYIFAGLMIWWFNTIRIECREDVKILGFEMAPVTVQYSFDCDPNKVAMDEELSKSIPKSKLSIPTAELGAVQHAAGAVISTTTGTEFCKSLLSNGYMMIGQPGKEVKVTIEPADESVPKVSSIRLLPCCELGSTCPGCYAKKKVCLLKLKGKAFGATIEEYGHKRCFYCVQIPCSTGKCANGQVLT